MAHINHALVGDPVYGGRLRPIRNASIELSDFCRPSVVRLCMRPCCELVHPITGEEMEWHSPLPEDMVQLIEVLRLDSAWNIRMISYGCNSSGLACTIQCQGSVHYKGKWLQPGIYQGLNLGSHVGDAADVVEPTQAITATN